MPAPTFIPGWENGPGTLFSGMKRLLRRWVGPGIVLFVLWRWAPRGEAPPLGIRDGRLSPCPASPNAVSSTADDESHAIEPLATRGRMDQAWIHCRSAVTAEPGSRLVHESPGYMRFEITTRWLRFVDDLEFLADPGTLGIPDRIQRSRDQPSAGRTDPCPASRAHGCPRSGNATAPRRSRLPNGSLKPPGPPTK